MKVGNFDTANGLTVYKLYFTLVCNFTSRSHIKMTITPKMNICSLPVNVFKQSKDVDNNVFTVTKNMDYESNTQTNTQLVESAHMHCPKHPTTYLQTLVHMLKGNIATGVFAMGDAFKNAGLLLAPVLTVFLGVLAVFNQHILLNCSDFMKKKHNLSYLPDFDETVYFCFESGPLIFRKFAKYSRQTVNIFLILASLGFCSVYFVFVSSSTKQILDTHGIVFDVHFHMFILLFVIFSFCLIRNLKFLAPVSFIATILIFIAIGIMLYFSIIDLPAPSTRKAVASLTKLPLFFGTAVYCFEGISLVLPLQREMKNPQKFNSPLGVLNFGMVIITLILVTTGSIGYLKYGDNVKGSLTLNLPSDNLLTQYVNVSVAIGVFLTYPLMLYVPVILIWPVVEAKWGPFKRTMLIQYLLRFSLVLITFFFAEVVPNVGLFISLLGSVTSTTLAFLFPPLCDIALRWRHDFGFCYWRLIIDIFTLTLWAYGLCTGAYTSLKTLFSCYF